jgi:hypothetical protein
LLVGTISPWDADYLENFGNAANVALEDCLESTGTDLNETAKLRE